MKATAIFDIFAESALGWWQLGIKSLLKVNLSESCAEILVEALLSYLLRHQDMNLK